MQNDHLILISGKSATGKSASLMNLPNQGGVIYLNCENGKKLPFAHKFRSFDITDCAQVYQAFNEAENMPKVHTIVIDTLTYLMELYESTRVLTAEDGREAWKYYAEYFRILMSDKVANSTKNVIFLAHTADVLNESEHITESIVKVKGSLMNNGIESRFTNVISSKKLSLSKFTDDNAKSSMFTITPEDEASGFKYVFQTRLTKDTVNERIRAPIGMWKLNETYIDNNITFVLQKLYDFYSV